jgi:hypothetical protein
MLVFYHPPKAGRETLYDPNIGSGDSTASLMDRNPGAYLFWQDVHLPDRSDAKYVFSNMSLIII